MKITLVSFCITLAFAACVAHPGMPGNGASGATRDRDPYNTYYRPVDAVAAASGHKPQVSTYTEQKGGSKLAVAQASNHGGGPVSTSASAK